MLLYLVNKNYVNALGFSYFINYTDYIYDIANDPMLLRHVKNVARTIGDFKVVNLTLSEILRHIVDGKVITHITCGGHLKLNELQDVNCVLWKQYSDLIKANNFLELFYFDRFTERWEIHKDRVRG